MGVRLINDNDNDVKLQYLRYRGYPVVLGVALVQLGMDRRRSAYLAIIDQR